MKEVINRQYAHEPIQKAKNQKNAVRQQKLPHNTCQLTIFKIG